MSDERGSGDPQAMLEFIARHTSDVIVRVSRHGLVSYVSPSIAAYGYTPQDVLGTNGLDLFHPEDRPRFAANTAALLSGVMAEAVDREHRFRRSDGEWVWLEGNPTIVRDAEGEPVEFVTVFRNVTRRREAQIALRESEARYRLIAETMSEVIVQTDPKGVIAYISPSVRSYGFRPEDLIGRSADHLVHPDDLAKAKANRKTNVTGDPSPVENQVNRFRTGNGGWVWLEGSPRPLRDADGNLTGVLNVLRDVTERRAQEDLFAAAFNSAPVAMTMTALDSTFLRVNPAGCRMLGRTEAELIGSSVGDFAHPEEVGRHALDNARLLAGEVSAYECERRFRRADGDYVWVHLAVSLVRNADGTPNHYISHAVDLTARRAVEAALAESEARHRTIAEKTADIICMADVDGIITYMSPSVRRLGFEPEEVVGRTFAEHAHTGDAGRIWHRLQAQTRTSKAELVRWRARHKTTGEWIWMESAPTRLWDPETGAAIGSLDVVRDISVQVRQEEALAQARADAEAAASVKSQFLANMSHEIRTPLTAVLGYTDLLATMPGLDEKVQGYVRRIAGGGTALLAIVNDILDFSKLEAGMVEVRPQPTNLATVVDETMALFEPRAAEKGLALSWAVDPRLPEAAMLDSDRLRQILVNLTGNAVKFTDQGGVSLRATPTDDGRAVRFEVTDTGAGLDPEQCARLFQRFNQIDGSTTRRHGGTGLGLAICKGLAEAMGGTVGVASTPGQGSVFHLILPLEGVEPELVADDARESASIAGLRVMVVDDNATNRELARRILESFDVQVSDAEGGVEALAQLAALPVDAVLMDLRMPGMDGHAALADLRAKPGPNRHAPVLAFTADADIGDLCKLDAFDGVARKPIEPLSLIAVLASAVAARDAVAPAAEPVRSSGTPG